MKMLLGGLIGLVIGIVFTAIICVIHTKKRREYYYKFKRFYWFLIKFIQIKQSGCSIAQALIDRDIHKIAIYGMKEIGELMLKELSMGGITVKYGIDRDAESIYSSIDIYKPDDDLEPVDMVIVTVLTNNADLIKSLKSGREWKVVDAFEVVNYCGGK